MFIGFHVQAFFFNFILIFETYHFEALATVLDWLLALLSSMPSTGTI